jgi:hypothetical protein
VGTFDYQVTADGRIVGTHALPNAASIGRAVAPKRLA